MDIVEYAEQRTNVLLTDWQKEFLRTIYNEKSNYQHTYIPRRSGKQTLSDILHEYGLYERSQKK